MSTSTSIDNGGEDVYGEEPQSEPMLTGTEPSPAEMAATMDVLSQSTDEIQAPEVESPVVETLQEDSPIQQVQSLTDLARVMDSLAPPEFELGPAGVLGTDQEPAGAKSGFLPPEQTRPPSQESAFHFHDLMGRVEGNAGTERVATGQPQQATSGIGSQFTPNFFAGDQARQTQVENEAAGRDAESLFLAAVVEHAQTSAATYIDAARRLNEITTLLERERL